MEIFTCPCDVLQRQLHSLHNMSCRSHKITALGPHSTQQRPQHRLCAQLALRNRRADYGPRPHANPTGLPRRLCRLGPLDRLAAEPTLDPTRTRRRLASHCPRPTIPHSNNQSRRPTLATTVYTRQTGRMAQQRDMGRGESRSAEPHRIQTSSDLPRSAQVQQIG
jgi:hypothetical protein